MPLIHIIILVEICDHYSSKRRFRSLSALLCSAANVGMKLALSAVFALNVVQNLISPAKDALTKGAIWNVASMLPGVGNIAEGIGDLLTGAGILIKGSAGVAALAVLAAICIVPWLKLVVLSALYKLAAAVCEPVCDDRISGCLSGVAKGGALYVKLLGYSEALFAVTVALAAASGRSMA
jgi:stage III sporulation protein AE